MENLLPNTQPLSGVQKMNWARSHMPLLAHIRREIEASQPLAGLTVSASIHMEAKTAVLMETLAAGGAAVRATGCNPLSTQDDVAAALAEVEGVSVFAEHGVDEAVYRTHLTQTLGDGPDIFIDDGGDLTHLLHHDCRHLLPGVRGGTEQTTTGVHRLAVLQKAELLALPMVAVNDAQMKYLFDNRYGTGQSVWDGILRTTNLAVAGKTVVVAGYGWCGKGVAMRARGLGARVIVCEINPIRAIEAMMDGFDALPMIHAAKVGDLFVTVTGCCDVLTAEHFVRMKDGAILCNAGHFDVEINLPQLGEDTRPARHNIVGYTQPDGRTLYVLGAGRLVNLACADGHPVEVMDVSFALQALCVLSIAQHPRRVPGLYSVPAEIDQAVATLRLSAMGGGCDDLTPGQNAYLHGDI